MFRQAILVMIGLGVAVAPVSAEPRRVTRAAGPIEIDGRLDEAAWSSATAFDLGYETGPGDNTPATVETTCYLTYDDRHVYLGCRAADPDPARIRARLSDRDRAFQDDFVGMVLDTFNDERQAYEFLVNPFGVQMDLTFDDVNGNEDESWDAIWDSAGRITETGYEVEIAVPFSSLRFQRGREEQVWGVDMLRVFPRDYRYRLALNPLGRDVSCYLCQFSKVTGFAGVEPGKNLEVTPTLTAGYTERIDDNDPSGGLALEDDNVEFGLDVKWGFTPNLTLIGTVNPDFSQVEADVAQIAVNEPFTLFYPEKRPFFLEGVDVFNSPIDAVYTRTVADPAWGAKITGKEGRHSIGVFAAEDEETTLLFPSSQSSSLDRLDEKNDAVVVRYRVDLGKNSAIGALVTARHGEDYHNDVYGVDALVRPTDVDTLRLQALGSSTRYAPQVVIDFGQPSGEFDGRALSASYDHGATNWSVFANFLDYDDDFRADLGFVARVGYTMTEIGGGYRWYGEDGDGYSRISIDGNWDEAEEQDGTLIERETEAGIQLQAAMQSYVYLGAGFRDRRFNGVEREENFYSGSASIRPTKDLWVGVNGGASGRFDFSFAPSPGVARHGDEMRWGADLTYNLGRHAMFTLGHSYRELDLPAGSPGVDPLGLPIVVEGKLFEAHLTEARIVYQFNVRTFLRLITQYSRVAFDDSPGVGAPADENEDFFNQFLFSYKLNPRTALFVGYADSRANQLDPLDPLETIQTDRTLFAKIGYAWVP
jgi:hypothetical protein